MSTNTNSNTIYQFKITLKGIKPAIWRRIQVPENYSFKQLHNAIQDAMGWGGFHLHQFAMKNPMTGKRVAIGVPEPDFIGLTNLVSENIANIAQYFTAPKRKATYLYDLGDAWNHDVTLEKILPAVANENYPKCMAGARACPPDDCGGDYGYLQLLKILADPQHPEYEDKKEWMDGEGNEDFDPEEFNLPRIGGIHKRNFRQFNVKSIKLDKTRDSYVEDSCEIRTFYLTF